MNEAEEAEEAQEAEEAVACSQGAEDAFGAGVGGSALRHLGEALGASCGAASSADAEVLDAAKQKEEEEEEQEQEAAKQKAWDASDAEKEDEAAQHGSEMQGGEEDAQEEVKALGDGEFSESSDDGMDDYGFPRGDRSLLGPPPDWRAPRPERRITKRPGESMEDLCERMGWPYSRPSASSEPVRTRPGGRVTVIRAAVETVEIPSDEVDEVDEV
eukprot:TRINITY_DN244_c0_g1_i2.p1 TRINITY_DN244_c0_g1~~TRINITY_DN244_c0_g1_i2.p1  ORF type:complete len:215 (+),score=89.43 TRINITY_DN244_c0_g1_i2:626-1270(+)